MAKTLVIVESPTKVPILSKFYCYVLESLKSGMYYVGCTDDYIERLKQHNAGYVVSTRINRPWKFIHKEEFFNLKDARKRERQIKHWKSRRAIERLINKI